MKLIKWFLALKLTKWFLAFLGVKMSDTPTPVTPVVPDSPPADPALRVIGVLIDTAIASRLTGPWTDAFLLKTKVAINVMWPLIGSKLTAFITNGKATDIKGLVDAALSALQVAVAANPAFSFAVMMAKYAFDLVWDKLVVEATPKLQAKGLV